MPINKQMFFLKNIEELKNPDVRSHVTEYEVITDANIIGNLTYGPYEFLIWEFSNKKAGEERKLCLRIREIELPNRQRQILLKATRNGFYHGGDIADELISLCSLFLRRRLKLGSIVREDDTPTLFTHRKRWFDKDLVTGSNNLNDAKQWFKLVEGLDSQYHQKFILAARLYHRALLTIEDQPDMAYLNLISAIEVLCHNYDIGKVALSQLDRKLSKLVNSIRDEGLRNKIREKILKREKFIKRRFIVFILDHLEKEFWTSTKRPNLGRIDPKQLPKLLARIYDQRSKTLHEGEPFPISVLNPPPPNGEEISISKGTIVRQKLWEPKDFIPHPHFFERLVNFVLKTFLMRN